MVGLKIILYENKSYILKKLEKSFKFHFTHNPHSQPYFDIIEIKKRITVLEEKEVHLVKKVSKELGLTYKELGEEIGYSEGNLRNSVFKNQLSKPLEQAINLYLENLLLKKKIEHTDKFKNILKDFMQE